MPQKALVCFTEEQRQEVVEDVAGCCGCRLEEGCPLLDGLVQLMCWRRDGSVSHVTAAVFHGHFTLCHSLDHVVVMAAGHTFPVQHGATLNTIPHQNSTVLVHGDAVKQLLFFLPVKSEIKCMFLMSSLYFSFDLEDKLTWSCSSSPSRGFIVRERKWKRPTSTDSALLHHGGQLHSQRSRGRQWQRWPRPSGFQHAHLLLVIVRGPAARQPERPAPSAPPPVHLTPACHGVGRRRRTARRSASQRARGAAQEVPAGRQTPPEPALGTAAASRTRPAHTQCTHSQHTPSVTHTHSRAAAGPRRQGVRGQGTTHTHTHARITSCLELVSL